MLVGCPSHWDGVTCLYFFVHVLLMSENANVLELFHLTWDWCSCISSYSLHTSCLWLYLLLDFRLAYSNKAYFYAGNSTHIVVSFYTIFTNILFVSFMYSTTYSFALTKLISQEFHQRAILCGIVVDTQGAISRLPRFITLCVSRPFVSYVYRSMRSGYLAGRPSVPIDCSIDGCWHADGDIYRL